MILQIGQKIDKLFQFTHPVWGATVKVPPCKVSRLVSIHAPRVGCDTVERYLDYLGYVSIHAPRVGCDKGVSTSDLLQRVFQFTHPVWGATVAQEDRVAQEGRFNSRTPCGVRLLATKSVLDSYKFQFTHPVWGATLQRGC